MVFPVKLSRVIKMEKLIKQIQQCTKCGLHKKRLNAVPGEGPIDAKIMFIGEAPGEEEDKKGRPFVGRAGRFLNELLKEAVLLRSDVFITNVVKCRPPKNRYPSKEEKRLCQGWLKQQIKIIQPKIIGTLGNHATETLIGKVGMKKLHGKKFKCGNCLVFPLYHPAAVLYKSALRAEMIEDMKHLFSWSKKAGAR